MKKNLKCILSLTIVLVLAFSPLLTMVFSAVAADDVVSSASSGKSSANKNTVSTNASNKQAYNKNAKILLIEDDYPWDSDANSVVLNEIGESYNIVSTSDFMNVNLWDYDLVIFANDQSFSTYNNYASFREYLELFADMGGVIVFGAGDYGWADGNLTEELPGGVKKSHDYSYNNYIVDASHPIVTGVLTDNQTLTNDDLYEYYCSHNTFIEDTLPAGANVILRSSDDNYPTLVEYPIGNGWIIASTLTWEFNYYHGGKSHPNGGYRGFFANKAMDDLFVYAMGKSKQSAENKYKIKVNGIESSTNNTVPVEDAVVSLYDNSNGSSRLLYSVRTNSFGEAKISVTGLTVNQLKNATISAHLDVENGSNISGDARNDLFNQFGLNSNGEPIRYIYQLHSEKIDTNGHWRGESLPASVEDDIVLTVTEPRLLVNLAVAYLVDNNYSDYQQRVKNTMSYVSELMAQSTDGHVMINKVLLVPTTNRLDFANTSNVASMADIQIQSTLTEGNRNKATIHSNAYTHGFFSDGTIGFYTGSFANIDASQFAGRRGYYRVQMSGKEGAGWNYDIGTREYATTVVHELGHYLFGLYDEYMNANDVNWRNTANGSPYSAGFGLMDNQHTDIELSRNIRDYAYLNGGFRSNPAIETYQAFEYGESSENTVRDLLTVGNVYQDNIGIYFGITGTYKFNNSRYDARYTLSPYSYKDRTADYSYAKLDDSDFIIVRTVRTAAEESLSTSSLIKNGNEYYYVSDTQAVLAYVKSTASISATFTPSSQVKTCGEYSSVGESTLVNVSSSENVTGEFYTEISPAMDIDYSSVSWFKYANNVWTKLDTDITRDPETLNVGARCDYTGSGLYVVMAEDAATNLLSAVKIVSSTNSTMKDGVTTLTVDDRNNPETISHYNIYYSTSSFSSTEDNGVVATTVLPGSQTYDVNFGERNTRYYVRIQAVSFTGATSLLSDEYVLVTGEADSDEDGIPDWYCDQYLLWGLEGENKDIANSDDNGNGLSNLEEYRRGNDPTKYTEEFIYMETDSLELIYKQSAQTPAFFAPGKTVVYTSSDTSVAVVDETGEITAVGRGTAVITATIENYDVSASCEVTVSYAWWQWIIRILLLGFIWY